jgi:hypothetical protein
MLVDFSDEFDARLIQQRRDSFAKVLFVHPIYLRRYFERNAGRLGDLDRGLRTFLRRNASEKCKIAAAGM